MSDLPTATPTLHDLERVQVSACANCGGGDWALFGATLEPDALHPVQYRCAACGLVFANPRVTPRALTEYYRDFFRGVGPENDPGLNDTWHPGARRTFDDLRAWVPGGRLLDVGSGVGAFLALARDAGYDVAGVELSDIGVRLSRERHGIDVVQAPFEDAGFEPGSFDVAHVWHVIEHVFDLGAFIEALKRALRPGGVAVVGTEGYDYPANALIRASNFLRGRVPPASTSTQHTFVFSRESLADCFERRGFETLRVDSYDELRMADRLAETRARTPLRRAAAQGVVAASDAAGRLVSRGPYLRGYFRRP